MTGRQGWRAAYDPNIRDKTPEGEHTRARMAALFDVQQRKVTEILGIEAGYRYVDSPDRLARGRRRTRSRQCLVRSDDLAGCSIAARMVG